MQERTSPAAFSVVTPAPAGHHDLEPDACPTALRARRPDGLRFGLRHSCPGPPRLGVLPLSCRQEGLPCSGHSHHRGRRRCCRLGYQCQAALGCPWTTRTVRFSAVTAIGAGSCTSGRPWPVVTAAGKAVLVSSAPVCRYGVWLPSSSPELTLLGRLPWQTGRSSRSFACLTACRRSRAKVKGQALPGGLRWQYDGFLRKLPRRRAVVRVWIQPGSLAERPAVQHACCWLLAVIGRGHRPGRARSLPPTPSQRRVRRNARVCAWLAGTCPAGPSPT